jgi:endoglucanase
MKRLSILSLVVLLSAAFNIASGQGLKLNDLEYFETQGVNVLVYSNLFTGGFNDEKTAGIELIHHGVRTAQGGAVRLSNRSSGILFRLYQAERLTVPRIQSSLY